MRARWALLASRLSAGWVDRLRGRAEALALSRPARRCGPFAHRDPATEAAARRPLRPLQGAGRFEPSRAFMDRALRSFDFGDVAEFRCPDLASLLRIVQKTPGSLLSSPGDITGRALARIVARDDFFSALIRPFAALGDVVEPVARFQRKVSPKPFDDFN
jgi:hypothetical protein